MNAIIERVKNEPALLLGLVGAVISLLLAFGWDATPEQQGAIMAAVVALLAVLTRSQVTPTRKVAAKEDEDSPAGDLVAGPASELPDDSPVDVIPAENLTTAPAEDVGLDDPNL